MKPISTLSDINALVQAQLLEFFPEVMEPPHFLPLTKLSYGDCGSEVFLRLSQQKKIQPEDLLTKLLPRLRQFGGFEGVQGYLNYRGSDSPNWLFTHENASPKKEVSIAWLQSKTKLPYLTKVRFASAILLQVLEYARAGTEVYLIVKNREEKFNAGKLPDLFEALALRDHDEVSVSPERALHSSKARPTFVWTVSHLSSKKDLDLLLSSEERATGQLSMIIPDRLWYEGKNANVIPTQMKATLGKGDGLPRLLYNLSEPTSLDELDLDVLLFNEHANLYWLLFSCNERLSSASQNLSEDDVSNINSVSDLERALLMRLKFISSFRSLIGSEGGFFNYLTMVRHLGGLFHRFFNLPEFRARLKTGHQTAVEQKILSFMHRELRVLLSI